VAHQIRPTLQAEPEGTGLSEVGLFSVYHMTNELRAARGGEDRALAH